MTVCIAAITLHNEIVTVSDTMISNFFGSTDMSTVKMDPFGPEWNALWAADDITQCGIIVEQASDYFKGKENTLRMARSCLSRAYQQRVTEIASDHVLGAFGMDMRMFRNIQSKRFTERQSKALMNELKAMEKRVTAEGNWYFLAFGYDNRELPHIFTVQPPGTDYLHDKPGFCAIGSGGVTAESLLYQLGQSRICTFAQTLVNCLFAKFMAEKTGAGKHTYVYAKKFGSIMCSMPAGFESGIRREWEDKIRPKIPDDLLKRVSDLVAEGYIRMA